MHPFKKMILGLIHVNPLCKSLVSFDYKGAGDITFRFRYCGASVFSQHTFSNLTNSGGIFFTYTIDTEVGDPNLCIEENTFERIGGSIVNSNNYTYGGSCAI